MKDHIAQIKIRGHGILKLTNSCICKVNKLIYFEKKVLRKYTHDTLKTPSSDSKLFFIYLPVHRFWLIKSKNAKSSSSPRYLYSAPHPSADKIGSFWVSRIRWIILFSIKWSKTPSKQFMALLCNEMEFSRVWTLKVSGWRYLNIISLTLSAIF